MNFLKKLFQKEKMIKLSELNSWLAKNIEFTLSEETKLLQKAFSSLDSSIQTLNNFDFTKIKMDPKIINRIKGNHQAYLTSLRNLHKSLTPPQSLSSKDLETWNKEIEKNFNEFNLKTIKNYHILKTVIGQELENIIIDIKKITEIKIGIMKKINEKRLPLIEGIHLQLKDVESIISNNNNNKTKLPSLQEKQSKLLEEETITKNDILILTNSIEFQDLTGCKIELEKLNKQKEAIRSGIISKIIPLERPLRKIAKENPNKEIDHLLHDKYNYIINSDAQSLLKNLKIKKIEPISLEHIKVLENEIPCFKKEHKEIQEQIGHIQKKIQNNTSEKELLALKEKLDSQTKELTLLNTEIGNLEKKEITNEIKKIEDCLNQMGFKIKIKDDSMD